MIMVHVIDVSTCGLYSMLVACFGLVPCDCTCYRCWHMGMVLKCIICRLQEWVHCAGISCTITCYGIFNMEYYFIIFIVRYSVFPFASFLLNLFLLVSVEFNFSRNLQLLQGTWNLYWTSNLQLGSRTGTHISVMLKYVLL